MVDDAMIRAVCAHMKEAGIAFTVSDPTWVFGPTERLDLTIADVVRYVADPEAWLARHYAVGVATLRVWLAWLDGFECGSNLCVGTLKSGRTCGVPIYNVRESRVTPATFRPGYHDRCARHREVGVGVGA